MDAAILHDRLAAAEGALIQIDERLDAMADPDGAAALEARIASLEGTLSECQSQLQTLALQTQETAARIVEAQAAAVEAAAAAAEVEAESAAAIAAALSTEQEPLEPELAEGTVEEIEPEPESDGDGPVNQKSPSWWENLFALR